MAAGPGREIGLQKGLSRMRGNSHVRFLEGLGARKSPWPTRRKFLKKSRSSHFLMHIAPISPLFSTSGFPVRGPKIAFSTAS